MIFFSVFSWCTLLCPLLGCVERRILPETPIAPMEFVFDGDVSWVVDAQQSREQHHWEYSVRPLLSHGDDSVSLEIAFHSTQRTDVDGKMAIYPLQGHTIRVRCFPWGELLQVENWEEVADVDGIVWLDPFLGALFPNPPKHNYQQWENRLLTWPYTLPEEPYSKQLISANWTKEEKESKSIWTYQGEWYGKRGATRLFAGSASGEVIISGDAWIESHTMDWHREKTIFFQEYNWKGTVYRK